MKISNFLLKNHKYNSFHISKIQNENIKFVKESFKKSLKKFTHLFLSLCYIIYSTEITFIKKKVVILIFASIANYLFIDWKKLLV